MTQQCVSRAKRTFESMLEDLNRGAETARKDALLSLAAGMRAEAEKSGGKISIARTRELLAAEGVQFRSDAALKMALGRAS